MASKAMKRRPCSSESDKTSEKRMETTVSDPVTEPLLGNGPHEEKNKVSNSSSDWVIDQLFSSCFFSMPFLFICRDMSLLHGQISGMGQERSAFAGRIFC
jgi:hypothetical protein